MASGYQLTVIICIIQVSSLWSKQNARYEADCHIWQNVTRQLDREPNVQMSCNPNPMCTGIDCVGTYSYKGVLTAMKTFEVDFCFGMAILPCSKPLSVNTHVDIPESSAHFSARVNHSETVQIPGAHYDIGQHMGSADGFVVIDMSNKSVHGRRYLKLGMKMKVRMKTLLDSVELWPVVLQRTLMPDSLIPVPACKPEVPTELTDTQCHKMITTTSPTDNKPSSTMEPTPSLTCETNKAYACQSNQMCKPFSTGDIRGKCVCMDGYKIKQGSSMCIPMVKTSELPIYSEDTGPTRKITTGTYTFVIIGSVLAVLAIISIIFAVVIYQYKKYQERYGQHQQLMNNDEEDDDDDPLDIAT